MSLLCDKRLNLTPIAEKRKTIWLYHEIFNLKYENEAICLNVRCFCRCVSQSQRRDRIAGTITLPRHSKVWMRLTKKRLDALGGIRVAERVARTGEAAWVWREEPALWRCVVASDLGRRACVVTCQPATRTFITITFTYLSMHRLLSVFVKIFERNWRWDKNNMNIILGWSESRQTWC